MLNVGFGVGKFGSTLIVSGVIALVAVILMALSAGRFSASQAAHETKAQVTNRELRRYGFSAMVRDRRTKSDWALPGAPSGNPSGLGLLL